MIVITIGRREKVGAVFEITIIPPGKGIGPEFFKQAEDRKKGGYPYDEIDELPELGSRSHCVNG
jgi:hypothetical protein